MCWLLSPGARYVTGATLRVDGGSSLWRTHWEVPEHDAMPRYGGRTLEEIRAEAAAAKAAKETTGK